MLNRIILIGRLTKDPELRYTPNGVAVSQFTLAVDRNFKNQQGQKETDFINIVVWQKQAESVANYLFKGKMAAVDGRLQIRNYEGKDGQRKYITEVIAETVRFLSPKSESDNSSNSGSSDFIGGQFEGADDDLPF